MPTSTKRETSLRRNLVAKYSRNFNKAVKHTDRRKAQKRGYRKHKGGYDA